MTSTVPSKVLPTFLALRSSIVTGFSELNFGLLEKKKDDVKLYDLEDYKRCKEQLMLIPF